MNKNCFSSQFLLFPLAIAHTSVAYVARSCPLLDCSIRESCRTWQIRFNMQYMYSRTERINLFVIQPNAMHFWFAISTYIVVCSAHFISSQAHTALTARCTDIANSMIVDRLYIIHRSGTCLLNLRLAYLKNYTFIISLNGAAKLNAFHDLIDLRMVPMNQQASSDLDAK